MELLKLLSGSEIVAQVINFLVLVFILRALAWRKIIKFLDDRRSRIALQIEEVEKLKLESTALKAGFDEQLKNMGAIAARKREEAVAEANTAAEAIKKEAHQEAARMMAQAQSNVRYEAARIKNELKDEIIDMVMQVTEQVVGQKMNPEDDRRMAEDFLKNLDDAQ
jgi:F-type H+-transporting ATPase subunit b